MRFVLDSGGAAREVAVEADRDALTVGELLTALGHPDVAAVTVDGRSVPADHTVAEAAIAEGATLALGALAPPAAAWRGAAEVAARAAPVLCVVAGVSAGDRVVLDRPVTVGRGADATLRLRSATVSGAHCRVVSDGRGSVTVTDLGSTNGTWVDGEGVLGGAVEARVGSLVRCGAVVLRVEPPTPDDRPRDLDPVRHLTASGTVPFNRPPRPGVSPPPAPVTVPPAPPAAGGRPPFGVAAMLAPAVLGVVLAVVMGSWRYALFMLFSPVMLLVAAVSGRRRATRDDRAAAHDRAAALARFAQELAVAGAAERARRWELLPSVPELVRRGVGPSTRLWERRPGHEDVLRLQAGVGTVAWAPPLAAASGHGSPLGAAADGDVAELLAAAEGRAGCPVPVELGAGGVVGVVGDRGAAVALARSLLLQACVQHGPADLPVAVLCAPAAIGDWDWTTWLPHVREPGAAGGRRLAATHEDAEALLAALREAAPTEERAGRAGGHDADGPTTLVVLDAPELLRGRDADARAVLRGAGGPVAGIVLAATADQLPAVCDTVVEVTSSDGDAVVVRPAERVVVDDVLVAGVDAARCRRVARALARLEDPEVGDAASELPARVDLVGLLPSGITTVDGMRRAWAATADDPSLATPLGVTDGGPLVVDLVTDGPHALLGGTTGAGKSELLRSLVAGLAATHGPDHCTFVLIDYKGGAAFDACAGLPHVVGLVTDLDEHLGARALRCLEAELSHRERRLRDAGVSDLPAWLALPPGRRGDPLPRLVVVVDELATLKAELPAFVDALVQIAQRGRSLGMHLVLGTQRPSGAVDDNVRANTNLRVALRMTDTHDATDVVGTDSAASIPPSLPGRGVLRRGPGDLVAVHTALVTGHGGDAPAAVRTGSVAFGPHDHVTSPAPDAAAPDGATDLERLVAASRSLVAADGVAAPRSPWPPPLPDHVALEPLLAAATADAVPVPVGLVDEPDLQRQVVGGFDPAAGNLLVHGLVGSGTTTTLLTHALAAAASASPEQLHLHVLDLGRGELAVLEGLPHCGAVVTAREAERRQRLQTWLLGEAERRRGLGRAELDATPLELVVVDGLDAWFAQLEDPAAYEQLEAVTRMLTDAPGLRMAFVASLTRLGGVRHAVQASIEHRLVHRLADANELASLGLRPTDVPPLPPGRALRPADGRLVQVARAQDPAGVVAALAARWPAPSVPPAAVGTLPARVPWSALGPPAVAAGRWCVPIGLDGVSLAPLAVTAHRGEHVLVLGAPGSGRTGLLGGLAAAAGDDVDVVVVAAAATPLAEDGHRVVAPDALGATLTAAVAAERPTLVLVDDAEQVPDPGPALDALAASAGAAVLVVAAARPDVVTGDYGHWLRRVARSRTGVLLRPTDEQAGDLLGARLPRRAPAAVTAGRGWLVADGRVDFVAAATR